MLREVFKSTVSARFFLTGLIWVLSSTPVTTFSLPLTDNYLATSRNFVEDFQNTMNFDNTYTIAPSAAGYTKIKERIMPYTGLPAGVQVLKADGGLFNISSWSENGFVIEFTVASTDGGFISFAPYNTDWAIKFQDIDLEPLGASTPEVLGIYFDFTNNAQELAYNLNPTLLSSIPIGVGKHPFENHDVIYSTSTGASFNSYAFGTITNNKLKVNVDSQVQFQSFSLDSVVKALGVSTNFNQAPKVNIFKVGVLLKGIQVSAFHVLPGDFNCDLTVDSSDYITWRKNQGLSNVGPCAGDADWDRDVDTDDYNLWRANFGKVYQPPAPAAGSGLEEPTPPTSATTENNSIERVVSVIDTPLALSPGATATPFNPEVINKKENKLKDKRNKKIKKYKNKKKNSKKETGLLKRDLSL
jgi:hypothetical protein